MNLLRIPAKIVCSVCETTEDLNIEVVAERDGTTGFAVDTDQYPIVGRGALPPGWESENVFADFLCPACKHGPRKV